MRAACFPFDVRTADVAANLAAALDGVARAREAGADLLVLPEMWPAGFPAAPDAALFEASDAALAELAQAAGELLVVGSAHGRREGVRPTNRAHLLRDGKVVTLYDKVHLFSPTAEAASFSAGDAPPAVVDTPHGRLAAIVCYDLRFPELSRAAFRAGAEVLCVVSQWPQPRAPHLDALLVGRAAESQAFVVACNRVGTSVVGRRELELTFPGRARIVSPGGETLALGGGEAGLVVADLDLDQVRSLRRQVPVARDERREVYGRW